MKNEILNILNDYIDEFKYYYNNFKKKSKKYIRKFNYWWNNPKNKYVKLVIKKIKRVYFKTKELINKILINLKQKYFNVKNYLLCSQNRKQNLTAIGIIILVNIISLAMLLNFSSYAIYKDEFEYSVLGAKIGDKYSSQFDYTLLVYVENTNNLGQGNGTYNLTSDIPTIGFTYSGYKCKNNSTLIFDESTKTTSVTTNQKEICSIYFDLTSDADVAVRIMLEDVVDSNSYVVTDKIPYYGYKYSHYECENNSTLIYNNDLHSVTVESDKKEYCSIYFQKELVDVEVVLYVENNYGSDDYIERTSIPSNIKYVLNETNSSCTNNNERVDSSISYTDGHIEIQAQEISNCKVYLDRKNA